MYFFKCLLAVALWAGFSSSLSTSTFNPPDAEPTVTVRNGTIEGTYSEAYHQDFFLGIPYALPPTGDRRFRRAAPLTRKWDGIRATQDYGPFCKGYSVGLPAYDQPNITYPMDEDCLTINVVRPAGTGPNDSLPVLVWIYGGGFSEGGSGDQRYNMSFLVNTSVEKNTPILMVSFNYRVSGFGFLAGHAIEAEGNENLGLHDQRMVLAWIQENIHAFGGDPARVTISGESAGAASVGFHLLAYEGRNDSLFSAAISESGGPLFYKAFPSLEIREQQYGATLNATGCAGTNNTLACLRAAPADSFDSVFKQYLWSPMVDGGLIPDFTSKLLHQGKFVKAPLLIGANTNEGTIMVPLFSTIGVNSTAEFHQVIEGINDGRPLPGDTLRRFDELYQEVVSHPKENLGTVSPEPGPPYGSLYGQTSLMIGDVMLAAGRRLAARTWADAGLPAYSYHFDTVPAGINPITLGAAHFQEVAFVFRNTRGTGYESDPFAVQDPELRQKFDGLAELMSSMWVSFVDSHSPNNHNVASFGEHWPTYSTHEPVNLVFRADPGSYLEPDTFRSEAFDFINRTALEFSR
ncbi:carboxylesterase family protein [Diplodia corticola]|uniref:Carboxylic ester hydrolase n=1 Tax=Diplodia corticola TaxID=236234 RepID=A0A1J9RX76_9PEZI|nr:carboxylesterase family protein [Diplodia corticola]OJD32085.1 carboxylesterase family protein [Diplodia corticola]